MRSGQPGAAPDPAAPAVLLLPPLVPPVMRRCAPPAGPLLLPPGARPPLLSALEPLLPEPPDPPKRCCWKGEGPRTLPELVVLLVHPVGVPALALALALLPLEPRVGEELLLLVVEYPAAPGGLPLLVKPLPAPEGPTPGSPRGR